MIKINVTSATQAWLTSISIDENVKLVGTEVEQRVRRFDDTRDEEVSTEIVMVPLATFAQGVEVAKAFVLTAMELTEVN